MRCQWPLSTQLAYTERTVSAHPVPFVTAERLASRKAGGNDMPSQRSLAVFVALSSIVAAAGCAGPTTDVPSDRVAVSASPSTAKTGDLIYVRNMQQGAIVAIDGDTGAEVARYLSGALTPDGALVYGTTFDRGDAVVRVTDIARNITANERRIEGSGLAYELPALSFTGEVGGFSPNARWLVLT